MNFRIIFERWTDSYMKYMQVHHTWKNKKKKKKTKKRLINDYSFDPGRRKTPSSFFEPRIQFKASFEQARAISQNSTCQRYRILGMSGAFHRFNHVAA